MIIFSASLPLLFIWISSRTRLSSYIREEYRTKSCNKLQWKYIFLDWVSWKQLRAWQFVFWGWIFVLKGYNVTAAFNQGNTKRIVGSIILNQFLICFKYLIFSMFVFTLSGSWVLIVVFFASQVECKFKAPSIYCSTTAIQDVNKSQDVHVFSHLYMFMCSEYGALLQ